MSAVVDYRSALRSEIARELRLSRTNWRNSQTSIARGGLCFNAFLLAKQRADRLRRDLESIDKHVCWLNTEPGAVSLEAVLPYSGRRVLIARSGAVSEVLS